MNRRLIREALLHLERRLNAQRELPRKLPIYSYYYSGLIPDDECSTAAALVHSCEHLPWPDDYCVILAEVPQRYQGSGLDLFVLVRSCDSELTLFFNATVDERGSLAMIDLGAKGLSTPCRRPVPNDVEAAIVDAVSMLPPSYTGADVANYVAGLRFRIDRLGAINGVGWTWQELAVNDTVNLLVSCGFGSMFAAMAFPCGYCVSVNAGSFGSKQTRKTFATKPILSFLNRDRLYRIRKDGGTEDSAKREGPPIWRHGHNRFLWKLSGVSIECLPRSPMARAKLAIEKNVRRTYVSPCWVGDTNLVIDGMQASFCREIQFGPRNRA